MEFAVVNNYMGPVATKAMKGYSDEDLHSDLNDYKVLINKIILRICAFCSLFYLIYVLTIRYRTWKDQGLAARSHNTMHVVKEEVLQFVSTNFHGFSFHSLFLF